MGLLAGGRVLGQLMAFSRTVFVARILTPEDYGLAATFWMTTSLLATITELGFQQRLIQAGDGDDESVGGVAQSLFVLRGLVIGGVLLLAGGSIARLFDAPEAAWAFRWLALLPILQGFVHRDLDRMKRDLNFKADVTATLVAEAVTTLAAVPIALVVRDYSTFLYLGMINITVVVLMSQILAERSFRLGWDKWIVRRFLAFGWPLLINSLLMYGMAQGDRVILAKAYTKAELGVYSVAIGLVSAVLAFATSTINPIVLPLMARVQHDDKTFQRHYGLHVQAMGGIALLAGSAFILLGPVTITFVYGSKYSMAATVVGWLGISQCLRLMRMPASNAAMARGDTKNIMFANVFRQSGVLLAVIAAWSGMSIEWIAFSGVCGELLALAAAGILLKNRHAVPLRSILKPSAFAAAVFAVSTLIAAGAWTQSSWLVSAGWFVITAGSSGFLYLALFPHPPLSRRTCFPRGPAKNLAGCGNAIATFQIFAARESTHGRVIG